MLALKARGFAKRLEAAQLPSLPSGEGRFHQHQCWGRATDRRALERNVASPRSPSCGLSRGAASRPARRKDLELERLALLRLAKIDFERRRVPPSAFDPRDSAALEPLPEEPRRSRPTLPPSPPEILRVAFFDANSP
jgi:hypothetical protein